MFVWEALFHAAFPFYNSTMLKFTNEDAITQAIVANAPKSGMYFLPYEVQLPAPATAEERKAAEEKMTNQMLHGPFVLASVRTDEMGSLGRLFGVEFFADFLSVLLGALLLLRTTPMSTMNKLLFFQGVFLTIYCSINISYWNWYSFSTPFMIAELVDQIVGWPLAGLVIIKILPGETPATT